ncbi:MAG TPA: HEAT repeat domain-containing protein [Gemmataceae bacterium]|jgi:HEAT repeat protein|nr:HEAT repeat domain-containing protein [Gemmataceae bacterium]
MRRTLLIFTVLAVPYACPAQEPVAGRSKTEWLKILKEGPTARAKFGALAALGLMEPKDRAISDAIAEAMLTDKVEDVRLKALDAAALILVRDTKLDSASLVAFTEQFGKSFSTDPSETVRLKGLGVARDMKKDDLSKLVPVLSEVLKADKSPTVRAAAAATLSKTGDKIKSVLNLVVESLKDPDERVRAAVADALGRVGEDAKGAIPRLIPLLKDKDPGVRLAAAFALGRIGPEAAVAVPDLSHVLATDTDTPVRKEAARAFNLLGLDAKAAVPALAKALREDKSEEVRQQAALALAKMVGEVGPHAAAMMDAIRMDADKTVRVFTVHALADSHGPALKSFVKDLAEHLVKEPDGDVRLAIVQELGALGPDAKDALPALNRMVADVQLNVRDEAKKAVKRVMESKKEQ